MERARNISKSMIAYLKRVKDQKEFLLKETEQYDKSKRHLANMMGLNEEEMTQKDVSNAIKYLFPSGMFDKFAHPKLEHPNIIYRKTQDAQFDIEGRPYHYLFYTITPNYYETLGKLTDLLDELNKHEDEQLQKGVLNPPEDEKYTLRAKRWKTKEELESDLEEKLSQENYDYFIRSLDALSNHPYSSKAQDFLNKFTVELASLSIDLRLPKLLKDENNRYYVECQTKKREHVLQTRVTFGGTGKIDIEGKDILYFDHRYLRQNVYFPIQLSGIDQDTIDIYSRLIVKPYVIGQASVSMAIRLAVAQAIAAFDTSKVERLRLAGLLEPDIRKAERKKFGQEGARRKYTWKKR